MGYKLGLVDEDRFERFTKKKNQIDKLYDLVSNYTIRPEQMNEMLKEKGTSGLNQPVKAKSLIPRPELYLSDIIDADSALKEEVSNITDSRDVIEQVEIQVKYDGYIKREFEMVEELKKKEDAVIPENLKYENIKSLSTEGRNKLQKIKPETIGQASRISGVSASDVAVLMVYLKN
jgi:tRNA uridine 5-carboxymethylaminomethyl modification enzyme